MSDLQVREEEVPLAVGGQAQVTASANGRQLVLRGLLEEARELRVGRVFPKHNLGGGQQRLRVSESRADAAAMGGPHVMG